MPQEHLQGTYKRCENCTKLFRKKAFSNQDPVCDECFRKRVKKQTRQPNK